MRSAYETPSCPCPYCGASEAGPHEDTSIRSDYDRAYGWYKPGSPAGSTANVDDDGNHITWKEADTAYRAKHGVGPRYLTGVTDMTDLREKIEDILYGEIYEKRECVCGRDEALEAILDLLRESVKPLEWGRAEKTGMNLQADCSFGRYYIDLRAGYGWMWWRPASGPAHMGIEASEEAAKAAAQADYTRRILSTMGLDQ